MSQSPFSPLTSQSAPCNLAEARSIEEFELAICREFCQGSAIDAALYSSVVNVHADLELDATGEPSTPIHDALGWQYTRFGYQARPTLYAAMLLNEDGSLWQAKLSSPRTDAKGKTIKYESVVGRGSQIFLPAIPAPTRQLIADRYGMAVPLDGFFWEWLALHPEIPLIFTEGGKKALALLSLGYVAIGLYGVNGGYCNVAGIRELLPDVERFAHGRNITLAFDADPKPETRRRVCAALARFGGLLAAAGADVAIANWDGREGKGVDDLIVQSGTDAWLRAYTEAMPLEHWQFWQRLDNRLSYPTALRLNQADLSSLDAKALPSSGIIAISSSKGTGKTKLLSATVADSEKSLAAGHRIALMRNVCQRLKMDYRGDLDRANGQFINGSGYSLRIGFCVDALLAIDPTLFAGCDLIIDEVVQVIRHQLMSATCGKDGKRPALLARLRELIRVARRVIVADADLDNATLHYIRKLRGDDAPVFLIRNDYQPQGYPVRFIEAGDRSSITADVLAAVEQLHQGKTLFIATDTKGCSKSLARLIAEQFPRLRLLLINSETSGGEVEREFISTPDAVLLRRSYDVVIASPSLATGISIEAQGIIAAVFGIFAGSSSTDADMAQALGRVREPVQRVVWCAQRGRNFSQVSRSTNPLELKSHLQQRTSASVSLIRSNLREDIAGLAAAHDWQSCPHTNLFAKFAAEQNRAMYSLRAALLVRLKHEGNQVELEQREGDQAARALLAAAGAEVKRIDAESIAGAEDITPVEAAALEAKESRSEDEQRSLTKFRLMDFYALESITAEEVLADKEGRRRAELLNLEAQLYPQLAADRTVRALEKQATWNQGLAPWDISGAELRRALRDQIGLGDFLTPDREWVAADLAPYAERARARAAGIKAVLHFTITPEMSDAQIIHQLLRQMGLKCGFRWSRSYPGHEGQKLRVYRLKLSCWQESIAILERRQAQREQRSQTGSLPVLNYKKEMDDPSATAAQTPTEWLTQEALADVRAMWDVADEAARAELRQIVPDDVLRKAIAS